MRRTCSNPFRVGRHFDRTQGSSFLATLGYMIPILSGLAEDSTELFSEWEKMGQAGG